MEMEPITDQYLTVTAHRSKLDEVIAENIGGHIDGGHITLAGITDDAERPGQFVLVFRKRNVNE